LLGGGIEFFSSIPDFWAFRLGGIALFRRRMVGSGIPCIGKGVMKIGIEHGLYIPYDSALEGKAILALKIAVISESST
jgi:hypothetical protein